MKKLLVFGLTLLAIALVFFAGATSRRFSARADALAGEESVSMLAPSAAAPPPPSDDGFARSDEKSKEEAPRKLLSKRFNTIQVIRGRGAGGYGDAEGGLLGAAAAPEESAGSFGHGEGGARAQATRAWFPETFLFEPLVVTGADGQLSVPVKVPDRLTTWRVLGLSHSREGAQAGAVASFLGTLPTYVDPVVPAFLVAGDEVRLPVQVVNTTERELATRLSLSARNATLSSAGGPVQVAGNGSAVQYVVLKAPAAGAAQLSAVLGDTDAVERTIAVRPAGRPVQSSRGGTLGSPRTLELAGAENPLPKSEVVRLQVFGGALALLKSELAASPGRGGVAEDAYSLSLAGRGKGLLAALGATPDLAVLRDLSLLATQRVVRHARAPTPEVALLLTEAALTQGDNPVLARLGERLADQVARSQRPDGTCQGATGWTLQRLLVATAACVRAVDAAASQSDAGRRRASAVRVKAEGAFERNLARIDDGYTAAAIVASGAVQGTLAEGLKEKVRAALVSADGTATLPVPIGVVRADGTTPSVEEATALAVLALEGDAAAPVADLGSALLGSYNPRFGWGDGQTNLAALRAVLVLFKEPLPSSVALTLSRDGQPVLQGTFDAARLQEVVTLEAQADGSSGAHRWSLRAEPAVPGLGFALTLAAHVPWADGPDDGVRLEVTLPNKLVVGQSASVALLAALPAGADTALRLSLPAGVQVDGPSLVALVNSGTIRRYETEDGAVTLHLPALSAGSSFAASLKVVPTLAGTLRTPPSQLTPEDRPQQARDFAPKTWVVSAR